jgi:hypothetical protein
MKFYHGFNYEIGKLGIAQVSVKQGANLQYCNGSRFAEP